MPELEIHQINDSLWELGDVGINLYLVAGAKSAILIDSGFGDFINLRKTVEDLCHLPVKLVHTHVHGDHTGSDFEWDEVWLHPSEWETYQHDKNYEIKLFPLEDGTVFDLGDRMIETIHVPGHSSGCVAFLDRKNRILFSGDTVMTQPVFMFNPDSSIQAFYSSMQKLNTLADTIDTIYPCHLRWPLEASEALSSMTKCAELALENDPEKMVVKSVDLIFTIAHFGCYSFNGYAIAVKELDRQN